MLREVTSGLLDGHGYEMGMSSGIVKVELRNTYPGSLDSSLLTSESGNPVGYLDFGPSHRVGDHSQIWTDSGVLGYNGYVVDDRLSYYPDFDEVNGGFTDHSPTWGFFINEQYRGQGIGQLMFGITLGIARELQKGRLEPRDAFLMVYKMMSKFFPRYFRDNSGELRAGVDYYEEFSGYTSALVFPDFEIPELNVNQAKKLEVGKHTYLY